jgi:hypothetical protein
MVMVGIVSPTPLDVVSRYRHQMWYPATVANGGGDRTENTTMSPGMMTSGSRGGFYNGRALNTSRNFNRALGAPVGRVYGQHGQRNKFAVSGNGNGGHSVTLADNEAATLTVNEDGSLTVEIINKPANGNGTNGGNGNGSAVQAEPVQNARRAAGRQVNRMSWEKDPSDGSVTFYPDADETLHVNGDALMANVVAEPSPPGSLD